jgi:UDP-N-acetylglucosamine:LPS N-acetylglucosamine transferase
VLLELLALQPWWQRHQVQWAAVTGPDTRETLRDHDVIWLDELRPGSPVRLLRAVFRAWRLLRTQRTEVVVSAGSGVAVPVFLAARLRRVPSYWIETLNVVGRPGLASRVCARLATRVLVQNVDLLTAHRRAVFVDHLY